MADRKPKRYDALTPAAIDEMQRDDAAYWATALMLAIQNGNRDRERSARAGLRRLGYDLQRTQAARASR